MQRSMMAMKRPVRAPAAAADRGKLWRQRGHQQRRGEPLAVPDGQPLPGRRRRPPTLLAAPVCRLQGGYKFHQYQVVGRHLPSEKDAEPTIYRMKLWATDPVRARSKFW
jgi:hypothetical protein